MVFKISLSPKEIEQLFLTYRNNPDNYTEIKKRLAGQGAIEEFKRSMRTRRNFIGALAIVAAISSTFSFFADHWSSFGAIWIIWAGFAIGIGISMYLSYKDSFLVIKRNQAFFEEFEQIAQDSANLQEFIVNHQISKNRAIKGYNTLHETENY